MKRRFAVLLLAILSLVPLTAHAGQWVQKEIFWSKGGGIPSSGAVAVHDTAYAPLPFKSSGGIDTTGKFTLKNADIWRTGHGGAATTVDTTTAAFLIIQQDSAGAVLGTVSSVTVEIDGRAGGFNGPATKDLASLFWTQVDSTVCTFVANGSTASVYNAVLSIPIRAISGLGGFGMGSNGPETSLNFNYRIMAFEDLRVRLTSQTGVFSGSLRAFIRYWDNDPVLK